MQSVFFLDKQRPWQRRFWCSSSLPALPRFEFPTKSSPFAKNRDEHRRDQPIEKEHPKRIYRISRAVAHVILSVSAFFEHKKQPISAHQPTESRCAHCRGNCSDPIFHISKRGDALDSLKTGRSTIEAPPFPSPLYLSFMTRRWQGFTTKKEQNHP